jgi:hypothetical protein
VGILGKSEAMNINQVNEIRSSDNPNKAEYRKTAEYKRECEELREKIRELQIQNAVMMYWNRVDFRYN